MIDAGLNLIIATGRTRDNALHSIYPLKINLPIISDNGTFIYDSINKKFLIKKSFNINNIIKIIEIAVKNNIMPIINALNANDIYIFYSNLNNTALKLHYADKLKIKESRYIKDSAFLKYRNENVFNISMLDTFDKLSILYNIFKNFDGISITFFPSYHYKGYWWLEILPPYSGKGQAVEFLRELYKPEKIVCFGDNLNDLCMFEKSDYTIAPSNAVSKVKKIADEVIGDCNEDSVAKYLIKQFVCEK